MSHHNIDITTLTANNKGLTVFAINKNSSIVSQVVKGILEGDTDVKGTVLTYEDPIEDAFDSIKGEQNLGDLSSVHSDHSTLIVTAKTAVPAESFSEANRAAMRRAPAMVLLGSIDGEDEVESAIHLALQDIKVIATTQHKAIGSILTDMISFFPSELRANKACELISHINMLVAKKTTEAVTGEKSVVEQQCLVFDETLKTKLLTSIKDNGYSAETLSQEINAMVDAAA